MFLPSSGSDCYTHHCPDVHSSRYYHHPLHQRPSSRPTPSGLPAAHWALFSSMPRVIPSITLQTIFPGAAPVPARHNVRSYGQSSAGTIQVSSPLNAADFGSITRADGTNQTTWKGWPLYYYASDSAPGQVNGENVQKIWFVVKPDENVLIAHSAGLRRPLRIPPEKRSTLSQRIPTGQAPAPAPA